MNVKRLDLVTCGLDPRGRPRVIISTDSVDAMNDRIMQAGLQITPPVRMMVNHNYASLPVGLIPDQASVYRGAHRTECSFDFFEHDAEIDRIRNLYSQGAFGASVGFRILESTPNAYGGLDITKSVLHEVSLTGLPANKDCEATVRSLFDARGGARPGDEIILDIIEDDAVDVDRQDLVAALRTVVPALVAAEVTRMRDRHDVIDLDDVGDTFDPAASEVDRAMLLDAIKTTVPALLRQEINRLKGRVD
jgi:hypothetical protein